MLRVLAEVRWAAPIMNDPTNATQNSGAAAITNEPAAYSSSAVCWICDRR